MNNDQFNKAVEEQIDRCKSMLIYKALEYAIDSDRLHNFKIASGLQGCSQFHALSGMMAKHTVSIYDMLNVDRPQEFSIDMWDEKITDHINYLLILRAMVEEVIMDEEL